MTTQMAITKALRVCERGPKTEAQRTQALAALRRFGAGMERDYPYHCADTCAAIDSAHTALEAVGLRGAG